MASGTGASGRAASQIRYALSQLRSRNGHHEFEHLCRELARVRITPDILPATGPVSAGGDHGRDFETFRTCMQDRLPGSFLAAGRGQRIVFACTLQRENLAAKIRNDLRVITDGGPVDRVYFFCEQDIPVTRRHELVEWARQDHGTDIEVIDGQALSELLAAEDCLWIAERYLGVGGPGQAPRNRSQSASSLFSEITGTGIGTIHGNVNIYHAAAAPLGAGHRRRQAPSASDSSGKRWRRTAACLIAVAAAVTPAVILAPWHHSPSPRNPGTVLDDVAARQWIGTLFYDRTFVGSTGGKYSSIELTLSADPSPSSRPGARVGSILYGEGCPPATVTLIRDDPRVLTLATGPSTGPLGSSCRGDSDSGWALYWLVGLKPAITIMLAGAGPQAGISLSAYNGAHGTLYRGILHISN
jgi:hypothetical protein